ncbi:hypothetical protein B0H13DRAFT_1918533 [Mycena leptocephala]|nr:hypothetical protein B0H13DRAFT_1918533 [Mycena leptocephala]
MACKPKCRAWAGDATKIHAHARNKPIGAGTSHFCKPKSELSCGEKGKCWQVAGVSGGRHSSGGVRPGLAQSAEARRTRTKRKERRKECKRKRTLTVNSSSSMSPAGMSCNPNGICHTALEPASFALRTIPSVTALGDKCGRDSADAADTNTTDAAPRVDERETVRRGGGGGGECGTEEEDEREEHEGGFAAAADDGGDGGAAEGTEEGAEPAWRTETTLEEMVLVLDVIALPFAEVLAEEGLRAHTTGTGDPALRFILSSFKLAFVRGFGQENFGHRRWGKEKSLKGTEGPKGGGNSEITVF